MSAGNLIYKYKLAAFCRIKPIITFSMAARIMVKKEHSKVKSNSAMEQPEALTVSKQRSMAIIRPDNVPEHEKISNTKRYQI